MERLNNLPKVPELVSVKDKSESTDLTEDFKLSALMIIKKK